MTALFGPSFTSEDSELMNFLTTPDHSAFLEGLWERFVVHNPFARNPLPNGWLKSGHEIWIGQGQTTQANLEKRKCTPKRVFSASNVGQ